MPEVKSTYQVEEEREGLVVEALSGVEGRRL